MKTFLLVLLAMNLVTFAVYGIDKVKAEEGKWRIPEATLIALAAAGGALGAFLGMQIFRHKTRKPKFYITVPALMVLEGVLLVLALLKF